VDTIFNMTLGSKIRLARKEAGFNNVETLAVELGVSQRTVQRWETDQFEPTLTMLIRISRVTGKPMSFFFSGAAA
jgi:transcriptional regulator with XRE-family HTH domain